MRQTPYMPSRRYGANFRSLPPSIRPASECSLSIAMQIDKSAKTKQEKATTLKKVVTRQGLVVGMATIHATLASIDPRPALPALQAWMDFPLLRLRIKYRDRCSVVRRKFE